MILDAGSEIFTDFTGVVKLWFDIIWSNTLFVGIFEFLYCYVNINAITIAIFFIVLKVNDINVYRFSLGNKSRQIGTLP